MRRRPAGVALLWTAFVAVHAVLTVLGVVVVPTAAFYDVDLYRYWMALALDHGRWPVLDGPWVYPAGALVPMLLPALVSTTTTVGYALGWCLAVTALNALAVRALLGLGRRAGAWWWLAFLVALGPVAIGRLDAVVVPLVVLALAAAVGGRRPARASALLTAGAWIKVAPGPLLLPLAAAARHPLRDVVLPAGLVSAGVVAAVAMGGGLPWIASFLSAQRGRGLQVESVTATPWVVAAPTAPGVQVALNEALTTYEVTGPGTHSAAGLLDAVLVAALAGVAALLWSARRRGTAAAGLLPATLVLVLVLVVANKVGSPQFITWLAPPVAVMLSARRADGHHAGAPVVPAGVVPVTLVIAGLTQAVFPWGYLRLLAGDPLLTAGLAARNALLVALLVMALAALIRTVRGAPAPTAGAAVSPALS